MKYFFSQVFMIMFLTGATANVVSGMEAYSSGYEFYTGAEAADSSGNSAAGQSGTKGKGKKDSQNQTEFLKPDMDAKDYNFYDRKKISTPLMPRYDLDSAIYQKGFKKKEEQQKSFIENKYHYPARPKDQWEIGIQGGSSLISGDIKPDWSKGWGGGFTVRKALNYYFSLRFSYLFSVIKAQDLKPRYDVLNDAALNQGGAGHADYLHTYDAAGNIIGTDEKIIFHNYKNTSHAVLIDGILNLGNIMFHRERTLVNVNVFFGVGFHLYRTQMDMLDKNGNPYNYQPIVDSFNSYTDHHMSQSNINKNISSALSSLQTGNYTVDAVDPLLKGNIHVGHYYLMPDISAGVGLDFHVSKWVTLGLEERFIYNGSSNLDGVNWQADNLGGFAPHYDHYFSTMVQLKFQIGKNRVEPLWWLNPLDFTYKKLSDANPDKLAKELFKDTDEDGVPDRLDKEPNTKKGCPVDVKGVILDSDKDGIPDCDDKEPFSPPGYPIDANGVAVIPPNPCCDNAAANDEDYVINPKTNKPYLDEDGKPIKAGPSTDEFVINPKTGKPYLDEDGKPIKNPNFGKKRVRNSNSGYDCSKMEMPGVFFDEDKYNIDPAYQSALHQIAEKLQMCPDVKMVITGVDESKNDQKYNEQLAYNRATSVVDYLVEKYGISRDRFVVKYQGGKKSDANKTPAERKKTRRVDVNYANDGEKGESNPPAPHPGLKAGSNK